MALPGYRGGLHTGMALRLTPGMQRMRLTIGGGIGGIAGECRDGHEYSGTKRNRLGSLVSTLGMSLRWQNLHEQDSTVKAPLEQAKVVANWVLWDWWTFGGPANFKIGSLQHSGGPTFSIDVSYFADHLVWFWGVGGTCAAD